MFRRISSINKFQVNFRFVFEWRGFRKYFCMRKVKKKASLLIYEKLNVT